MTFAYQQASSLGVALECLVGENALPIAGGTSLVPRLRRRAVAPRLVVGVARLPELSGIRSSDVALSIGAAATLAEIARSPEVLAAAPLLAQLCAGTRSPQIRNAATLGGSLLSGPDFAEPALALLALGARSVLASARGEREMSVADLFAGEESPRPGELIVRIDVPRADGLVFGAHRVARREAIEPPLVAAAVALGLDAYGTAREVRICLGVATPRPVRLRAVEEALLGTSISPESARRAVEAYADEVELRPDVRAGESYRRRIIPVVVARGVEAALGGRK